MSGSTDPSDNSEWRLLRVQAGERLLWLCVVNPELWTYVYIPDSGRFHLNKGVFVDYVWDGELTYVPIDVQEARDLIAARVGALPPAITSDQRRRYLSDEQLDTEVAFTHVERASRERDAKPES
ncbi:hypothetical protein [Microbacterium oxydans]|uniref:Uncharacterized protein n=1 Tax=Microbacterium oxydans TaxID=82380 RepID=A0A0F0L8N2_9MICO|nr:hypothetical protein [Microbacterium oxydans]KJL29557.1 hypothetical protein RS83_01574 [Microbacterium oxydans]